MTIEYRQATLKDAELLIEIYNALFYSDYLKYGEGPGYGKTKEMMEKSIKIIYSLPTDEMRRQRRMIVYEK